jgi:hypothetical protein
MIKQLFCDSFDDMFWQQLQKEALIAPFPQWYGGC